MTLKKRKSDLSDILVMNCCFESFVGQVYHHNYKAEILLQDIYFSIFSQGMVEAGLLKPVTITWTPPQGHDVSLVSYSSSRLNVHLLFSLFPENRKSIPKMLIGKRLLKNVTLQILNLSQ